MNSVTLGKRIVGDGQPTFITFEAGPTHDGVESAKRLIAFAADAGADAVKFQILDPDRLVADKKQMFEYEILLDRESGKTKKISEPLYDLLARRSLNIDEWKELKKYADKFKLGFFCYDWF